MAEFYVMTRNAKGDLYFSMDGMECFPASGWTEAKEGVVTEPEVVETIERVSGGMVAIVRGKMVETEEIGIDELIEMCPNDVTTYTDFVVITDYKAEGDYLVKVKGQGLVPVKFHWEQKRYRNKDQHNLLMKEIAKELARRYAVPDKRKRMELLIRNFVAKDLHCASRVTVYQDCMFEVLYPGAYRDSCSLFVFDENGNCKNTSAVRYVGEYLHKSGCSSDWTWIELADITREMDKWGIAVGEDSGDEVEGISPEERKYLSTRKLPGGSVIVMFKAETFCYDLLQNEKLTSVVCKEIAKWMHNLGGPNDYISWID